jgi:ParB family chromosome partitioning protein
VKEAVAALGHADEGTVRLATRLLGRVSDPDAAVKKAIGDSLTKWWATWQERRAKPGAVAATSEDEYGDYDYDDDYDDYDGQSGPADPAASLAKAGEVVECLLYTAGRVGVPAQVLADVAKSRPDDPAARGIRLEAVRCLATGKLTPPVLDGLEALATGPDADVRVLSAELLARFEPKRAAKLAMKMLKDRPSFNRLTAAKAVHATNVASAAGQVHYQPVALPILVAEKDVPTLAAVAKDRKAAEAARLGAVEGLGVMAAETAEKVLVEIGTAKDDDKEIRKAAWRALRRSKRARKRGAPNTLVTTPKAPKAEKKKAE